MYRVRSEVPDKARWPGRGVEPIAHWRRLYGRLVAVTQERDTVNKWHNMTTGISNDPDEKKKLGIPNDHELLRYMAGTTQVGKHKSEEIVNARYQSLPAEPIGHARPPACCTPAPARPPAPTGDFEPATARRRRSRPQQADPPLNSQPIRVVVLAGGFGGARMAHGFAQLGDRVELTRHRQHRRRPRAPRPARLARPRHGHVHAGRPGQRRDRLGRRGETWSARRCSSATAGRPGSGSATATWRPTSCAPRRCAQGERADRGDARDWPRALGVGARLLPMTDEPVRTESAPTRAGSTSRTTSCAATIATPCVEVRFDGIEAARAAPKVSRRLPAPS